MKKITILLAGILFFGNISFASNLNNISKMDRGEFINHNEPISFIERGIEFYIFPNGEFDFNTRPQDSHGEYFFRKAGKRNFYPNPKHPINYGVLIEQDNFGRVRRVGNNFINYDLHDRVTRIGTVYMSYNRFSLVQVGGLKIIYNRNGDIVDTIGSVKGNRYYCNTNTYYSPNYYNNAYYHPNYNYSNYNTNGSYYYYRKDGTKAKYEDEN